MMMNSKLTPTRHHKPEASQAGISLVIVMIFLVILSVLGISAIQTSTLSSRVARNEADRNLAFQAAEAAIRDAQLDVNNLQQNRLACVAGSGTCRAKRMNEFSQFDAACTDGRCCTNPSTLVCATTPAILPVWEDTAKWIAGGGSVVYGRFTGAPALPVVAAQPRYLLEPFRVDYGFVYRITAVGYGANDTTQVMLQSTVKAN